MTSSTYKQLLKLMPPPKTPFETPAAADWERAETALGLRLPPDFKKFVSGYGNGQIADFMCFWNPASSNHYVELVAQSRSTLDAFDSVRKAMRIQFDLHPEVPGLLPYAGTDNGDTFAWLTEGRPDEWPTVILATRGPLFIRKNSDATSVLLELLSGQLRHPIFPEDFPPERIAFTPFVPVIK